MNPTPDWGLLAAQIVAGLAAAGPVAGPLAAGLFEGVGGEVGKAWLAGAGRLWQALRGRFAAAGNARGLQVLQLFAEDPSDEDQASALGKQVLRALAADPRWAAEMRALAADPRWAAEMQALVAEGGVLEIVAREESEVFRVKQRIAGGAARMRLEAEGGSKIYDVEQDVSGEER